LPGRKKTWRQLASRCWSNLALRVTCFLSASVTRNTWTYPTFQRHYRFRPTTSGSSRAKDVSVLRRMKLILICSIIVVL
jgi:hypothetical protein